MTIVITELFLDPTKTDSSLSVERLQRRLAERFDPYLRSNHMKEIIALNDATGLSDEHLEKMLTYGMRAMRKIWS
jgi:hypothetical protein